MSILDIDQELFRLIHADMNNSIFDMILPCLRNKYTWIPLYIFFIYHLYTRFQRRVLFILVGSLVAILISDLVCAQVLKNLIARLRPCVALAGESWLRNFELCSRSTFSFPSCHAANHAAISAFIWHFFRRSRRWLFILWVVLIGYSQVYVGQHYPLDIIGGACFGFFLGWTIYNIYNKLLLKLKLESF